MRTTTAVITTIVLAFGALSACTQPPVSSPTPIDTASVPNSSPSSTEPSASPSPASSGSPTASATPSGSPSQHPSLDATQTAAMDLVVEFYRLQNEFGMDDSLMDLTPITNITTGDAQLLTTTALNQYRELDAIQTAPVEVRILSVGAVTEDAAGSKQVQVEVCSDATDVDLIDKNSGKSVLSGERSPVNLFTLEVIEDNETRLISSITDTPTDACP